jgi:hypothetical protein
MGAATVGGECASVDRPREGLGRWTGEQAADGRGGKGAKPLEGAQRVPGTPLAAYEEDEDAVRDDDDDDKHSSEDRAAGTSSADSGPPTRVHAHCADRRATCSPLFTLPLLDAKIHKALNSMSTRDVPNARFCAATLGDNRVVRSIRRGLVHDMLPATVFGDIATFGRRNFGEQITDKHATVSDALRLLCHIR